MLPSLRVACVEMTEPEELSAAIIAYPKNALEELEAFTEELTAPVPSAYATMRLFSWPARLLPSMASPGVERLYPPSCKSFARFRARNKAYTNLHTHLSAILSEATVFCVTGGHRG